MPSSFRFLHCADLHLDSPFKGMASIDENWARKLADSTFTSLRKVVDIAIAERVDLILLAGDIYDSSSHSLRSRLEFRDAVKLAGKSGIQVYMVHGNHDPLDSWKIDIDFPENFHRFGPDLETERFTAGGSDIALISGISYPVGEVWENLSLRFRDLAQDIDVFRIGMLHCNLSSVSSGHENYSPCTIDDLCRSKVDYWALGHVHNGKIIRKSDPAIVYPGNIQGRHVRESGRRGCYLVDVLEGQVNRVSFRDTSNVLWHDIKVDVSDLRNLAEVADLLMERCSHLAGNVPNHEHVVRFTLCGRIEAGDLMSVKVDAGAIEDAARDMVRNHSLPVVIESVRTDDIKKADFERLLGDENFIAEFLEIAEYMRNAPYLLREILPGFEGFRNASPFLDMSDVDLLLEIVRKAEEEGLDRLLGRYGE